MGKFDCSEAAVVEIPGGDAPGRHGAVVFC